MALKVMTLNVLFGGQDRFEALLELVARESPDLLVMQECLGWDDGERLRQMAAALGPEGALHAHLGSARPRGSGNCYHVALVSRLPVRDLRVHNDPHFIGHALVQCELDAGGPVTFFGTHYDAHHEKLRFVEARYLRSLLEPVAFHEGLYLLAGDLNSLSRKDPYPVDLADKVRMAGVDKYGHPPRFDVIDDLEEFGWVDTLRLKPASPAWVTAQRVRNGIPIDYRTDYIFASPRMAERLVSTAVVDVNGATDHNAVVATFHTPAPGT